MREFGALVVYDVWLCVWHCIMFLFFSDARVVCGLFCLFYVILCVCLVCVSVAVCLFCVPVLWLCLRSVYFLH